MAVETDDASMRKFDIEPFKYPEGDINDIPSKYFGMSYRGVFPDEKSLACHLEMIKSIRKDIVPGLARIGTRTRITLRGSTYIFETAHSQPSFGVLDEHRKITNIGNEMVEKIDCIFHREVNFDAYHDQTPIIVGESMMIASVYKIDDKGIAVPFSNKEFYGVINFFTIKGTIESLTAKKPVVIKHI
jgi:hypothetical protein